MNAQARIRYLAPEWREREDIPEINSRETRRAATRYYDVVIEDARPLAARGELGLDSTGFVLLEGQPPIEDVRDERFLTETYCPRVAGVLQRETGARRVIVLHYLNRYENPPTFAQAYARYVHSDFAPGYVERLSRRLLLENGVCSEDEVESVHYAWFNSWQGAERVVETNPLTLVDARTVSVSDIRKYTFGESEEYGGASIPFWSPAHRHYYFPNMRPDEMLLFRQYDSRTGLSGVCPHTSFDDPATPPDTPPRRSVEVRMLALLPD